MVVLTSHRRSLAPHSPSWPIRAARAEQGDCDQTEDAQGRRSRVVDMLSDKLALVRDSGNDENLDNGSFLTIEQHKSKDIEAWKEPKVATVKIGADHRDSGDSGGSAPDIWSWPDKALPRVAVVGRPNVGKSALFNRVSKTSEAIVYDTPGVTRDRLYRRAFWGDKEFMLVDTGGLTTIKALDSEIAGSNGELTPEFLSCSINQQARAAVEEAESIILVVDGQEGPSAADQEILRWLRKQHGSKPIILAVNKCESHLQVASQTSAFWEWGLDPIPVSAISGAGTGDLMDKVAESLQLPKPVQEAQASHPDVVTIAIVGRPNVGKSSLLNALVGEERSIVSSLSGTTRDAIDYETTIGGQRLRLVDTAGIRKRPAVAASPDKVEPLMVEHTMRAIRRANVVALLVDAKEGITQQDLRLARIASDAGCALVVVANKWDLVDHELWTVEALQQETRTHLRDMSWAPVVVTSLKDNEGGGIRKVVKAVFAVNELHKHRVSTATLNLVVQEAVNWRSPPACRGSCKRGRVFFATQPSSRPPTFVLFVNDPDLFPDEYRRYLENQFRENIGLSGTPIRLLFRRRKRSQWEGHA
eukprot:evm.model.scf_2933.1 EVM.evm.TU.scf_2933.1   scf_2933:8358-13035(+)